jgi:adenylate cyclase
MAETRKLGAILAADVVGSSRFAGFDEDLMLARLRAVRSDLIDPVIAVSRQPASAGVKTVTANINGAW